jgi:large subunit ribosomal protein L35
VEGGRAGTAARRLVRRTRALPFPAAAGINRASNPAAWPRAGAQGMPRRRSELLHERTEMPKLKTKSGAKKRFSRTATGKVKANVAHKRHRLISKPKQMKRKARGTMTLEKGDSNLVLTYMPYMRG